MQILTGLFDNIVLQRNEKNKSEAVFTGESGINGTLRAVVTKHSRSVRGFDRIELARVRKRKFKACLTGLPAGGPYDVKLEIEDRNTGKKERLKIKQVLVGDVWLLGGQSNMQGVGLLKYRSKADPMVRAFYMNDTWKPALDPIHNLCAWDTVDQIHIDLCGGVRPPKERVKTVNGVGPGVSFGQKMRRLTGVPQGIIACAHGGSSMSQWDPKLKNEGGKSLYGAMLRRFHKNGSKAAGLIWYQGESDADANLARIYTQKMKEFITALRKDTGNKSLPLAMVQIGRVVGWGDSSPWNSIQEQQRKFPDTIKNCTVVPAVDLALDDGIHISGKDQCRLGVRLARAVYGRKGGITVKRIFRDKKFPKMIQNIIVEFNNISGKLESPGRPSGFSLSYQNQTGFIYSIELRKNRVILKPSVPDTNLGKMDLWYGHGTDPYCNIVDEADQGIPVFGPVRLGEPGAMTEFVRNLRVSRFLPSAGKLKSLDFPGNTADMGFKQRTFAADFCDMHLEIGPRGAEDPLVYFACRIKCREKMKLAVHLGYDGPAKMWIDGKKAFYDPDGINPAIPDEGTGHFTANAGEHEVVVALGSNSGRAWGIFLRFERLDVTKLMVEQKPWTFAMPEILG